jgi:hypothetical protein
LGKGNLLYFGKASEAMDYFKLIGCSPHITMNPSEFLLDLANGNMIDISVPSELNDKVHMGNAETETSNGKPSAAVIQEVNKFSTSHYQFSYHLIRKDTLILCFYILSLTHPYKPVCKGRVKTNPKF